MRYMSSIRRDMTKEEFEALINKYLSEETSEREDQIIEDFFAAQERKESEEHYSPSESMWSSIEDRIRHKDFPRKNNPVDKKRTGLSNRRFWKIVSVAAVLATAFVYLYFRSPFITEANTAPWITLDAPNGQKSIVTLADGTRIFLNGGSSVSYPEVFLAAKREVKLSGEAFFEVAGNPKQPFIVTAGNVTTKVLGTSFNIQAFPDKEISVTVATGRVRVEIGSHEPGPDDSTEADRLILMPNDQAIYNPDHGVLTVAEVNIEKYLAWKDNTLLFEDASIEEVAKTLERWYNVTIVFDNDRIKTCRINGKYKDQSLESVLKSIQYMYHVDFRFSLPNKVNLNGKDCNAQKT